MALDIELKTNNGSERQTKNGFERQDDNAALNTKLKELL